MPFWIEDSTSRSVERRAIPESNSSVMSLATLITIPIMHTKVLLGHERQCQGMLAERYARLSEKASPEKRLEELGAGLLLRIYAHVSTDKDLSVGRFGKPALVSRSGSISGCDGGVTPNISISHDAGLVVLAMCDEAEIGVDVARLAFDARVARRLFGADSPLAMRDGSNLRDLLDFTRAWAELESKLKGTGLGFAAEYREKPELITGWNCKSCFILEDGSMCDCDRLGEMGVGNPPAQPVACLSCACQRPFSTRVRWVDDEVREFLETL